MEVSTMIITFGFNQVNQGKKIYNTHNTINTQYLNNKSFSPVHTTQTLVLNIVSFAFLLKLTGRENENNV